MSCTIVLAAMAVKVLLNDGDVDEVSEVNDDVGEEEVRAGQPCS